MVVDVGGRVVVTRCAAVVDVRGGVVVPPRFNDVLPGALAVPVVATGTVVKPEEEPPLVRVVVGTLPWPALGPDGKEGPEELAPALPREPAGR